MNPTRLTNRLLNYWGNRKSLTPSLTVVNKDIQELKIMKSDIRSRSHIRTILNQKSFQDRPPCKKTGIIWTKERRMREYWANIKSLAKLKS